jgi:hypothetical protein
MKPEELPMRYAKSHHFAINQSRAHLRPQRTFFFIAGDDPGSYSKPYASFVEAVSAKQGLTGSWQGEGTILEVQGADLADARRRAGMVHKGWLAMVPNARREPGNEEAATELLLYLENDTHFAPHSPSGQGHAILLNMLRMWRKGTYDPERAPQGWSWVVEEAAKSYAKEFDHARNWHRIFTPATRDIVAHALAHRFVEEAQSGELDHYSTARR